MPNQQFQPLWMMVIVARIAAGSYRDTTPFIYGVAHAGNLRAELSLSYSPSPIQRSEARKAGIAPMPADAVPSPGGARTGAARPCAASCRPAHADHIFDNQKHKALEKFWNSGLKTAPRANPG